MWCARHVTHTNRNQNDTNMKFKILEKRGTYRIQIINFECTAKYDKNPIFGWIRAEHVHAIERPVSRFLLDSTRIINFHGMDGMYNKHPIAEFDSYESAANHIWNEYGRVGYKSIERPDWKQV